MITKHSPKQGDIVLCRFPFADTFAYKSRPALVLSAKTIANHITLCFITSGKPTELYDIELKPNTTNHLKSHSTLRISKIASVNETIVFGQIGSLTAPELRLVLKNLVKLFGLQLAK